MKKNEFVSAKLFDELYFKYQHEIKRRVVAESNVERLREKIKELKSEENNSAEESEISKADKMFGDLGYWKREYPHKIEYYKYNLNLTGWERIYFSAKKKMWYAYCNRHLSTKEHLAIREKMKELGWVDE